MGGGSPTFVTASSTPDNTTVAKLISYEDRIIANNGVLFPSSKMQLATIGDGTSNQFMIGETKYFQAKTHPNFGASYPGTWASAGIHVNVNAPPGASLTAGFGTASPATGGCGVTITAVVNGLNTKVAPSTSFCASSNTQGSYHTGGAMFAMCDGSVTFISNDIPLATLRNLSTREDGNSVSIP
jgi:prepilin-type processing-associated H-X9-DG protein